MTHSVGDRGSHDVLTLWESDAYKRGWDAFCAAINGRGVTVPTGSTEALHWSEGFYDAAADYAVWGDA